MQKIAPVWYMFSLLLTLTYQCPTCLPYALET